MSNVVAFPRKESLVAIRGRDKATGRPVTFLEYVTPEGRCIVAECYSEAEVDAAVSDWCSDQGVAYPFPDGAA